MVDFLKEQWTQLASNFCANEDLINQYWQEIYDYYSSTSRHYHNLSHLHHMFQNLEEVKSEIHDLESVKFAIWYHDIIYKSTKKDNEEKSADLAEKRLKSFNLDKKMRFFVQKLIVSTKKHKIISDENLDNAYLLDLDLAILGSDWETYKKYIQNIRNEYRIYPNFLYNPGRKKVLLHFLERESLYFTTYFKSRLEDTARENLNKEINSL